MNQLRVDLRRDAYVALSRGQGSITKAKPSVNLHFHSVSNATNHICIYAASMIMIFCSRKPTYAVTSTETVCDWAIGQLFHDQTACGYGRHSCSQFRSVLSFLSIPYLASGYHHLLTYTGH